MWFRKQNKILREQSATTGMSVSTLLASLIIIVSKFNLEDSPQPFPAMRDDSSIRIVSRRRIYYLEKNLQQSCVQFILPNFYIYHTKTRFKEKPPDSMEIPNTSKTRIVSHMLRFKLYPAETKD